MVGPEPVCRLASGWSQALEIDGDFIAQGGKRLRDEFVVHLRASGLTRDECVRYEQLRQVYIGYCTVHDWTASLETFLDTRSKHLDVFLLECARSR